MGHHQSARLVGWLLISGLVLGASACSEPPVGCKQFVTRHLTCSKSAPEKQPAQLKRCIAQLAHSDMGRYQQAMFGCVRGKDCNGFNRCVESLKLRAQLAATQGRLKRRLYNLRLLDSKNMPLRTAMACPRDVLAKRLASEKDKTSQALAQEYYAFCLAGLPRWLDQLRRTSAKGGFVGVCALRSTFLDHAKASATERQAIQHRCDELRIAGAIKVVRTKGSTFLKGGRIPARCHIRWLAPLLTRSDPAGKRLATVAAQTCYGDLGTKVLQAKLPSDGVKLDRATCRQLKPILGGFNKLPTLLTPARKTLVARAMAACKR